MENREKKRNGRFVTVTLVTFAIIVLLYIALLYGCALLSRFQLDSGISWNDKGKAIAQIQELKAAEHTAIMDKLEAVPFMQSKSFFPERKGLGQGGTPLSLISIPESKEMIGLFIRDPNTKSGFVFEKDMSIISSFELKGETPPYVNSLSMPTKKILMISGNLPTQGGVFRKGLFQCDWESKQIIAVPSRELFYNPASYSFDGEKGLTLFQEGRMWVSLNSERPRYSVVLYFSSNHPQGVELFRMSYDVGVIKKVYWESKDVFYFSTLTDMPFSQTSPRLWKLSLKDTIK